MLFQNAVVDTALWQKTSSLTLQIWYIIPADKEAAFLQYIRETIPNGVGLSYIKQLLPQIPRAQMAALGAVRIVQEPGQAVITCPVGPLACRCVSAGCKRPHVLHSIKSLEGLQVVQGLVFHFTLSCGTSEAEATNFYLDSPDTTFVDIWRRWCRYARECTEVRPISNVRVHIPDINRQPIKSPLTACAYPGSQSFTEASHNVTSTPQPGGRRQKPRRLDNWAVDGGGSRHISEST